MNRFGIRQLIVVAALSLPCLTGPWVYAQSFSIASGGFTATSVCGSGNVTASCQVATNGSAQVAGVEGPTFLQLTPALGDQTGSAWYVTAQPFASGFDTQFQFQLSGGNPGSADGFAFLLQTVGLSAIGFAGNGGALGYGGDDADTKPATGIPQSVAFEFDIYQNPWDPVANHVAIQSCGPNPNTSHHGENCPSLPSFGNSTIALAPLEISLTGSAHLAEIKYVVTPPPSGCFENCPATTKVLTISIDGNVVLTQAVDLNVYLGQGQATAFVGFTAATGALNNNQDIYSWSYIGTQQAPSQPTGGGKTNTFTFNPSPLVQHTLAFPGDAQTPLGIDPNTLTIQSANNFVSDSHLFPEYTVGSPFAPAHCFIKPGDVVLSGGVDVCSLYEDTCSDATHPPAESNCPFVPDASPQLIQITDQWDAPSGKVQIAPGTTAAMIHFYPTHGETWDPFGSIPEAPGAVNPACTDATSSSPGAPPNNCDLLNLKNFSLLDDPTSSGGTKRKGKFISVYGVPMLETTASGNGTPLNTPGIQGSSTTWFRTSMVNLSFVVNPAQAPPAPNNNFLAAPVNQLTYRLDSGVNNIIPDTTTQATDLTHAAPFNVGPVPTNLADGLYTVTWTSLDNVNTKEQNIQLVPAVGGLCPDGSNSASGSCYTTNPFSAKFGVDTLAPSITLVTPPGPQPLYPSATYPANSTVLASYSCADATSGPPTCVGPVASGTQIDTKPAGINTPKTFTVTSTDMAGNTSMATAVYNVSCHYVLFGVNPSTVARGGTVTVTTSITDCQSSNQKLTIQLTLSGPLGYRCSNLTLPMLSFPLTVPAGTSKSYSFPVRVPKCQCGGTFTLTTKTLVNRVQVDQTSVSLTVQ